MNSIYRRSARIAFFLLVAVAGAASTSHSANAQNFQSLAGLSPYTKYQTFDTEHFHFIYEAGYFEFTKRAALHIEHAHEILQPIFKWTPRQKTHILIADHSDAANGLTSPALRIGIVLIATPPDAWLSTSHTDDWIKLLVFHEYTHFLNIDPTTEWMEAVRIFFGDAVRPNGLLPIWMLEGLAVYYETKTSRMGRGRSPYYEGILRAFVNEGRLGDPQNRGMTLDRLDGDFPYFPGGESPYLFGYHLWDQLAKDQTLSANPDDTIGELSIRSSHRVPYFLEGNLSGVTGKNWIDYWDSFVAESKARFAPEIEKIKSRGETPHAFVTHSGYSAVGGVISPNGKYLAYTESTMTEVTKLVLSNLDTHEKTIVREKTMGIGMAFTPDSKFLIYSSLARFQTYDLFSDLFAYNLETGSSTPLTHGLRAKDPTLSPDGKTLAFVSSQFATHELKSASLSLENGELKVGEAKSIYPAPSFAILGNPKFISDQEVVFSSQEIGQTQSDLKIASLNGQVRTLLADGAINRFPIFDSGKIDFVSSKNGIENVYQISLEKNSLIKPLTNVITGVEFPFVSPKHELYASLLTSDGFEIAKFEAETSVNSAQNLASPANSKVIATPSAPASIAAALTEPKLDIKEESAHDYSAFGTLAPRGWAPVTYLTYGTYAGYSTGGYLLGFDDTGKQQYFANFAYNFKPETLDGSLDYTFSYFRPIIDLILS